MHGGEGGRGYRLVYMYLYMEHSTAANESGTKFHTFGDPCSSVIYAPHYLLWYTHMVTFWSRCLTQADRLE